MRRKRPIYIANYASEKVARLTMAALETMFPKARHGFAHYGARGPWIVASDVTAEQFARAAAEGWAVHCREPEAATIEALVPTAMDRALSADE